MNTRDKEVMRQMTAAGIALVAAALVVTAAESVPVIVKPTSGLQHSVAAPEAAIRPTSEPSIPEPKEKKSARPVPKPVTVEPRTPEEAAERAADRKDPSGALIIKPPEDADAGGNRNGPAAPPPSAPSR